MSDARSNKRLASSVSSFRLCRFVSSSISSSLSTSEFSEFSSSSSNPKSLKNWRAADATEALPVQLEDVMPTLCQLCDLDPSCPDGDGFARAWSWVGEYARIECGGERSETYLMLRQALMARRALLIVFGAAALVGLLWHRTPPNALLMARARPLRSCALPRRQARRSRSS